MTRRTWGGKARNGITCSHAFSHAWVMTGKPGCPLLVEGLERRLGGVGVDGGVDRFEVAGDLLALAPRQVAQRVADEVHDACLDGGLGEDRLDRLGEALRPSTQQIRMSWTPRCLRSV